MIVHDVDNRLSTKPIKIFEIVIVDFLWNLGLAKFLVSDWG
jgi:hypothetical protein